jgi:DNA-binding CsgD family transcriptional regulator
LANINAKNGVQTFLPPVAKDTLLNDMMKDQDPFVLHHKFSPREMDIIHLIKREITKQIATLLELSVFTVKLTEKISTQELKVQSTAELVALMHKFNL